MTRFAAGLIIALNAGLTQAVKLDDALSPRQRVDAQMQWTHEAQPHRMLSATELNALNARVRAHEVRLNTAAYVGRTVRIFLGLPVNIQGLKNPAGLRMEWQTRGPFAPGATQPGSRSLIFQGQVTAAVMTDVFDFTVHLDGQSLDGRIQFDPQFELEVIK